MTLGDDDMWLQMVTNVPLCWGMLTVREAVGGGWGS